MPDRPQHSPLNVSEVVLLPMHVNGQSCVIDSGQDELKNDLETEKRSVTWDASRSVLETESNTAISCAFCGATSGTIRKRNVADELHMAMRARIWDESDTSLAVAGKQEKWWSFVAECSSYDGVRICTKRRLRESRKQDVIYLTGATTPRPHKFERKWRCSAHRACNRPVPVEDIKFRGESGGQTTLVRDSSFASSAKHEFRNVTEFCLRTDRVVRP